MADLDQALAYSQQQEEEDRRRQEAARLAFQRGDETPDEIGARARLADETGLPRPVAAGDLAERAADANRLQRLSESNPRLRRWLDEPHHFEIARDDVHDLSWWERAAIPFRFAKPLAEMARDDLPRAAAGRSPATPVYDALAFSAPSLAAPYLAARAITSDPLANRQGELGAGDVEMSRLQARRMQLEAEGGALSAEDAARLAALRTRPGQDNYGPFIIGATRRLLPQIVESVRRAGEGAASGFRASVRAELGLRAAPGEKQDLAEAIGGPVYGAAAGYLGSIYDAEAGGLYDSLREEGVETDIAHQAASQYGAWAVGIEFVSDVTGLKAAGVGRAALRPFLGSVAASAAVRRPAARAALALGGASASQAFEESAQRLAELIHEDLAHQAQRGGGNDILAAWANAFTPENIASILQSGYIGAQGGFGFASVPAAINLHYDSKAWRQAGEAAQQFEQMAERVQASKTRSRHGPSFESAIDAMTGEAEVFVDADGFVEHFQQLNQNPFEFAASIGVSQEALAQALQGHGQLAVRASIFANRVLADPQHAVLGEHARLDPTAMSPAQARVHAEVNSQNWEKTAAALKEAAQSAEDVRQEAEGDVRAAFAAAEEAGGPPARLARTAAQLYAILPATVVARARADAAAGKISPAELGRIEAEQRGLYKKFRVTGPADNASVGGRELFQRGARTGPPLRNARWDPPAGVRLSERERKIAEMRGGPNAAAVTGATYTLEEALALRDRLIASGYPRRGIYAIIAERMSAKYGIEVSPNGILARISKYNKKLREQSQQHEPAPTMRRSQIYDLATPEARQEWFEQEGNVVAAPIPGEALDSRQYGFALDNGMVVTVDIAPEAYGATTISWTFLHRTLRRERPFANGAERLGPRESGALLARLQAVIEADAAAFSRDAYVWTPENGPKSKAAPEGSEGRRRVNRRMAERAAENWPYRLVSTADDDYLLRDGARILADGAIGPAPENANQQGEWDGAEDPEVRQDAFHHQLLDQFGDTLGLRALIRSPQSPDGGNRRDGGSGDGLGGEHQSGGGISRAGERGNGNSAVGGELNSGVAASLVFAGFEDGRMGEAVLKLRDAATLASLVHEFGHLAHAALESLSQDESAPAVYREMWDATLSWWGVTAEEWAALDFEGRRPLFEQWAETFELWIREGKSPSLALRSVFETLSGWLKAIYRTLAGLPNARLSPDIRDVFERLLASDEEIAQARALSGADIDMSREAFRTDADYQAYRAAEAQTRAALEDKVRARAQEAHTRAGKRAWRVQRETQRAAAQRYVDSDPARRAERWLAFQAWDPLPDTELSEEGEIGYVAPANALETMPADLPEMQLDEAAAAADWPGLNLPPALAFRLDPEAAMAEAMRLKRAGKGKQPARLWAFVKAQGGLSLEGLPQQLREKIEALKLGRKRPGVLNAKTGASAEALMAGAEAAGYFGLTLRGPALRDKAIGQGMELFQQAPPSDKAPSLEEFIDALVADLSDARRVYSANDGGALGAAQNLSDARAWFEDNGVDLSATKETIRAQVEAALAKRSAAPALHPEEIAPWFGFSSGDEMMRALAGLKPRAEAIEARMDEIAAEQWGDPVADGTLREEALEAAHAEAQARKIEIELAAIETAGGGRKSALSARAKEYARSEVEEMSAREVRGLAKFLAGERRAAKDAIAALEKGDVADAALAKSRQLISFWLYHFAAKAGAALDRIEARWGRYSKSSGTRAAIGPKHIAQIDAILDSIETGKPSFRPQETLAEWAEGLKEEGAEDLLIFNPETVAQQIKRPLSSMSVADIRALNDVLANIEAIGRARIKLRKKAEAERVADVVGRLKERIAREWAPQLAKNQSLVAPNTGDKIGREWRMLHARLIKMDYLSRYLDGLKDGGPWMEIMGQVQDAENAEALRNRDAAQGFMELVARHYSKRQFAEMLSKRVYIAAIDDSRTKAQLIAYALNVGNAYNKAALLRGEGWSEATLQAVLAPLETNDRAFVQGLWNYVGQWKEESFALDERTLGSRPPEVLAEPFAWPDGSVSAGGYWPVAFSPERGDLAAQREAKDSVIGVYGAGFRQAATNRGRLKARTGTKGQPLSDDFLGVLARHAADSIRDITHRELVVTLRRVKADKELRAMVARAAGRDAVRALDDWVYRLGSRTPVAPFGTWAALPKYLRRAGTGHAMGFKVSVATLNLLGHLQAIPRNGVIAQMKQAGISVVVGFPDLLARHLKAFATGRKEVSARVAFVHQRSAMMAGRRNSFDRDIADMKGNLTGRREGTLLPIWFEELLMDLNAMTDQAVAVPTWMAAYESALAGKVKGVSGEDAAARYADSVVRMTISAGSRKDLAAMIGSNDEWQRLATMFMGWANTFYNQLTLEQFPGIAQGKISPAKFAANMLWVWLLPAVVTAAWYGHDKRDYDESEEEYWARMGLNAVVYPLGTIPFVRDLSSTLVQGYRPQTPYTAAIDRAAKFASAVERADERQMVKQGYMLAGQTLGLPAQLYVTGDYLADLAAGEEDPAADPADALSEALLRDTR